MSKCAKLSCFVRLDLVRTIMCVTPGLNDAQEKSKVPSLGHTAVEDCGYIMPKFSQCGDCISLRPGVEGGHRNQMGVSWE